MTGQKLPSDRSFGAIFFVFFCSIAAYTWWHGGVWFYWPLLAAGLTGVVTLICPQWLRPFNRMWMKLAMLLNHVVSPIVIGVIFFGIVTPIAMLMRLAGRDTMNRRFDVNLQSYWIERQPPGPDPKDLPNQF